MLYFIDGYNLLFRLFHSEKNLIIQRNLTIEFLRENASFLKLNFHLIFDAHNQEDVLPNQTYAPYLKIIYTPKGQTADEYILERIFFSKTPSQIMVITNDNSLALQSKDQLAQALSIDDFIDFLSVKENSVKKKKLASKEDFIDTKQNIQRLLKIFEEKLENDKDL